jgi:para-aminobenzoate synthetase/4-amino-4-deoxychorismate lyase
MLTVAPGECLVRHAAAGRWLHFRSPLQVIRAEGPAEVRQALGALEEAVEVGGHHAAGFVAYEAAPALDPALAVRPGVGVPLVWFGVYGPPEAVELPDPPREEAAALDWRPSVDAEAYGRAFARVREAIRAGETYQVNLSYRLRADFAAEPWSLFLALARAQQAPYAALVDTGRHVVCSASPELFLARDGERVVSRPMKGTAPRGLTLAADRRQAEGLRASAKDRAENVMIVDMVRNDFGRVARTGSVRVGGLFELERYPTVWQLTSEVQALTDASLVELLAALFPAASITGAPKPRTMGLIAELECSPRGVYTGSVGFLAPGRQAQLNVAIRTVVVDRPERRAEYGVGGGVVWDSTAPGELAETRTKAAVLTRRLPAFSLLETLAWDPQGGFSLLERHLARLAGSAEYFGYPLDLAAVRGRLDGLARGLVRATHRVRLLVDEGGGISLEASPLEAGPAPGPVRVALARTPVDPEGPFLYHKTTHRRVYEQARAERPGYDDVLLWNVRGELTESTIANLVVELDGVACTPPVSSGLLPGTYRGWLLDTGQVVERVVRVEDLARATRVELVNSVRGRTPVELDPKTFP